MATILYRNLFYNQCRQLHRSAVSLNILPFNLAKEQKSLADVMPEIINTVVTCPKIAQLPEMAKWMDELLNYTILGGKLGRGLVAPVAYEMLEKPELLTKETLHQARILGGCAEMSLSTIMVMDDIVDTAVNRRGKPCWYTKPNIGISGCNDAILMHQTLYEVLKAYFGKTPTLCSNILNIFNEAILVTAIGEVLEAMSIYSKQRNNIEVVTLERFGAIAIHKTAYFSFRFPILLALQLVKNGKERFTNEINDICFEFGKLLQCQNDYLDVYGDDTLTGKKGTDIKEGTCTWLAATALQLCNEAQRSIFVEYYGSKEPGHAQKVKQLFDELNLPQLYEKHESAVYERLLHRIHALPRKEETQLFLEILNACYKRIQ